MLKRDSVLRVLLVVIAGLVCVGIALEMAYEHRIATTPIRPSGGMPSSLRARRERRHSGDFYGGRGATW